MLWTWLLTALAAGPRALVDSVRRWRLGRRGVVRLTLSGDGPRGQGLEATILQLDAIQGMARDPAVRAVVLRLRTPRLGWATVQSLRAALDALREAGKLVVVHTDSAGNQEMVLAAAADRVWLTPSGELTLMGVGARLTFIGEALARLGIQADLLSAGAYKSFGESYTRSHPTPQNREAVSALVEDLHAQLVDALAKGRRLDPAAVRDLMERAPLTAQEAVQAGLVDGALYPDQAHDALEELLDGPVRPVPFKHYARMARLERWLSRAGTSTPRVAVVHLEGPIVHAAEPSGGSGRRIEAERVVPVLDELRRDLRVRAVVLYVNSPGGSALASDLIARAVTLLTEKKPVVAVFGDVSASGGYYLSAPAAEIVAQPGTLTGSIGVVGGKIVLGPALARVGVMGESIEAGPNVGIYGPWAPFTPEQRERFRATLVRTYQRFLEIVAGGRKKPVEAIAAVAEGRVWSGQQAREHGLIDHLGDLGLGLRRARALAGLPATAGGEVHYDFPPPRFRMLTMLLGGATSPDLVKLGLASLGRTGQLAELVRAHPGQPLLMLPWVMED